MITIPGKGEDERDKRMDVVAQNGNDGFHYVVPETYELDVSKITTLEDIKDVLDILGITIRVTEHTITPEQKLLIDDGIFKQVEL